MKPKKPMRVAVAISMLSFVLTATDFLHAGDEGRRQRPLDERSNVADQPLPAKKASEGTLPQGNNGLAAKYPGDAGLSQDPHVILVEGFEGGSLEALKRTRDSNMMHGRKWSSLAGAEGPKKTLAIASALDDVHGGKHSLKITVDENSHESGGLFTRLKKGRDQLFARMYIKFAPEYQFESHTGFMMTASTDKTPWFKGSAGIVPHGNDRFGGTLEPEPSRGEIPPGHWTFYSYWHEMKGRWGNNMGSKKHVHVPRGKWICIELMFKANSTPQKRDGECAYWIDGKLIHHRTDLHWRTSNDLKLNSLYPHHYMNKAGRAWGESQSPRVQWFDDIVVATQYIGPVTKVEQPFTGDERK